MVQIISSNITSPLGMTTDDNYQAVLSGQSGVAHHDEARGVPFAFQASLLSEKQWSSLMISGHTRFESIVLHSLRDAIARADIDITSDRVVWILSTTKGNIELLEEGLDTDDVYIGNTATKLSREAGFTTNPIVVCNACISGVSAQVLALRLIEYGTYDHAIVTGADVQGRFIISGFQSLKALSPDPCRPFDMERLGLNLGEAAATIVYGRDEESNRWTLAGGAVCNDAYHISGPHPHGEGSCRAITQALDGFDATRLAVVGVHGTATMYNDQMESRAISRAGLSDIPLSALKGYYGHTMGAAGVLETIVTARALDDGTIPASKGFSELGVSGKVTISASPLKTEKKAFLKLLSGFGGCNGAILMVKGDDGSVGSASDTDREAQCIGSVRIDANGITLDGNSLPVEGKGKALLTEIYKTRIGSYPRFYKMDMLSRLAFVATQLLVQDRVTDTGNCAIVLFNASSSIVSDREYMSSIRDRDNFFPSPSSFVYTLPNITTGEIAMYNRTHGETSFYILPEKDSVTMQAVIDSTIGAGKSNLFITGWIDCYDNDNFCAELKLLTKQK